MEPKISLAPEILFHIGHFPVSNAFLTMTLTMTFLIVFMLLIRFRFKLVPNRIQAIVELLIEKGLDLATSILEDKKKARKVFPLVFTLFLFILVSNMVAILPLNALVRHEHNEEIPIFRVATSDYGMVLILTLIVVITVQLVAIISFGPFKYLGKFFNFKGFFPFFIGILELIGEFAKIISLSFRLFGNIFAGEVLMIVVLFLMPWILPIPFLFLAIFVGVIQAFVFSVLTLVFISSAMKMESH
jgi:F-type H+-transporting ATPase subunit a